MGWKSWSTRSVLIAAMTGAAVPTLQAAEKPAELKQGPGFDEVVEHCNACHSLDYILMNGPFLDVAGWDAEVAKMINAFGAPIDHADAKVIAQYLGTNYGLEPRAAGLGTAEGKSQPQRSRFGGIRPNSLARRTPRRDPASVLGALARDISSVLGAVERDIADHGKRPGRE
jgi:hypothetical protein